MQNDAVPTSVQAEINKLLSMQADLVKTDDLVQKRQKENSAANSELLALQIEAADAKVTRQKFINRLLIAVVTVFAGAGTSGAYYVAQPATAEEKKEEAKPVLDVIEKGDTSLETQIKLNTTRAERLRDLALEQQVQISDNGDYTRLLIRAAHPKLDESSIVVPSSIPKARKKAKAIKRARKQLLDPKEADPFADIEKKN